ncbi:MAG: hypothetical protein K8S55_10800 [Phycisphaerae bacterium]|nr:hypothetical protein [Phycisphaerae bacterium]
MKRTAIFSNWMIAAIFVLVLAASSASAGPIGYVEDFSLAADRTKALKQLIPGTDDYYYYTCLHYQNTGQFDKIDGLLKRWTRLQSSEPPRYQEIRHRQMLLTFDPKNPDPTMKYLKWKLGLHFNHQQQVVRKLDFPTRLDEKLISRKRLIARAFGHSSNTLSGFEHSALRWLAGQKISNQQRLELLNRLQRPDIDNLVELVAADLKYKQSRGFGSLPIHRIMLKTQLDKLLKVMPNLLNQTYFVNIYLTKLVPDNDADRRFDPKVKEAYFDRQWEFVKRLAPMHNSLKAAVLYHRLKFDRSRGVYDKDRFMTYLKLPRPVSYMNPKYLARKENRLHRVNLRANYNTQIHLPPIGNDEKLVRSYLMHFFLKEDSYKPYAEYINNIYLRECFAETKILAGIGDMEKWYSLLPPAKYKRIKDRVDIDFAYTNKKIFSPDKEVVLGLDIKNVKKLIVKVYEINAYNYYREKSRELNTAINLDGLVANHEKVVEFKVPAIRRVRRTFRFDRLKKRGVYVVEFIGNGKSSRALIRKGRLRFLERTGAAGQVFTVLDEANRKVTGAKAWIAGHEYTADKDGAITVPFSTRPKNQPIILSVGNFASLGNFYHQAENYKLFAGIHVERESLLKNKKATVVIRPVLKINTQDISLKVLQDVTLVIRSRDIDGVVTTKEVPNFKLREDRETTYEFAVPDRLSRITFRLKAKVKNLSRGGKKQNLSAGRSFSLNKIDRTTQVEELHFTRTDDGYVLSKLGKNGEVKADSPVNIQLKSRDFKNAVHVSLQTDKAGRIMLGQLKDIVWISAQTRSVKGRSYKWYLPRDSRSYPTAVNGLVGQPLHIPYMGKEKAPTQAELSLLEMRGGTFVKDRFSSLSIKDGFIVIDDLSAGDYNLKIMPTGPTTTIRLTGGEMREGYALSGTRHLQVLNTQPLQITGVDVGKDKIKVQLANTSDYSRVTVAAARYSPAYSLSGNMFIPFVGPKIIRINKTDSLYVAGRKIGDEYRYIIERQYVKKYPGNMLTRAGLLLNPWAIRSTDAGKQRADAGGAFRSIHGAAGEGRYFGRGAGGRGRHVDGSFTSLDFLAAPAVLLANLTPDADGVVTIDRKALTGHQDIRILAVDPDNTVWRSVALTQSPRNFRNLRLRRAMDSKKHFAEQKQITALPKGGKLTIPDIATSKVEAYDSIARVYNLYRTLNWNSTLVEFSFITRWPKLKDARKRELYSKYACHELNFFLYRKDPEFFKTVIKPYMANKKDKTFVDLWLLGQDVSEYAQPWKHGQMNIVERIMLARVTKGERPVTARAVKDLWDMIPPDPNRYDFLFRTAIKGRSLDTREGSSVSSLRPGGKIRTTNLEDEDGMEDAKVVRPTPMSVMKPRAPGKKPHELSKLKKSDKGKKSRNGRSSRSRPSGATRRRFRTRYVTGLKGRGKQRQLYRKLDKTKEWAENNYYHLPIAQQNADLVKVNGFWKDYAAHTGNGPFVSKNLAEASGSFTEMMLAMAVLDLPFEPGKHKTQVKDGALTFTAGGETVVFHREIKPAETVKTPVPILVSQNFFRHGDRYIRVNNRKIDKYVTDEFLPGVVYGCCVVITNPTSSQQRLEALLQVPAGAMPVAAGQYTRSVRLELSPYHTHKMEYYFYFPAVGKYPQYPVHVAKDEKYIASAKPFTFNVVPKLSKIDKSSWDYISQFGTGEQVIDYLKANNLNRLNLAKIAWRVKNKDYYNRVIAILNRRHVYNMTLYSYGIRHADVPTIRQYLQYRNGFVNRCGMYIRGDLLTIDPIIRKTYQHIEYLPLVNARSHQLGNVRKIVNERLSKQYHQLLKVLSYHRGLDDDALMAVTYYMLLQDRVEEGLKFFARVKPEKLATRLQYDYFRVYTDFYKSDTKHARTIAEKYRKHPVDRWRKAFAAALAQLDEIDGKATKVIDTDSRAQQQTKLAATAAGFEFKVENRKITLNYQNLKQVRVNYYKMNIELLFSRNPFVQQHSGQFSYIRPNATALVKLSEKDKTVTFDLPKALANSNVLVEIVGGGVKRSQAYYAHSLGLQIIENYGQVKVTDAKTGKALPKVYVKVYARMTDGTAKFYKDGYTDLRGRFDYTSLNTNVINHIKKFSLLILSDTHGAVVREAAVPKR